MTTVLADLRLGVMAADSSVTDGDRVWKARKVWRWKGHLLGFCGNVDEIQSFLGWWKNGCVDKQPKFDSSEALVLSAGGLVHFNGTRAPETIALGVEAIGTGAKAAMCAYDAMGWRNTRNAVRLACRYDAGSRVPVRTYKL
jgi:ATP-dependent protease HslVU (ClpYQ) peptidase subunit